MSDYLKYLREILARTVTEYRRTALVRLIVEVVVPMVAIFWLGASGADRSNVVALLVIWVALLTGYRAPFLLWKDQRTAIADFEKRFTPALKIEFLPGEMGFLAAASATKEQGGAIRTYPATYVRCRVSAIGNTEVASCRAFIMRIERMTNGSYATILDEALACVWSASQDTQIALARDIPRFIDLVFAREPGHALYLATSFRPFSLSQDLRTPGTYRISVAVTGDKIQTERLAIEVTRNSNNSITAILVS